MAEMTGKSRVTLEPPRLRFGPYLSPSVQVGEIIECQRRGEVMVRGWSEGEIPWPLSRRSQVAPTLILCGDLVRAVQEESAGAVALAWGVSRQTVFQWRQALGVPRTNEGSRLRWRENIFLVLSEADRLQGLTQAHLLSTRQKAEATKRARGHVPNRWRWTDADLALLGTLTDAALGERLGCCERTVTNERRRRGVEACKHLEGSRRGAPDGGLLDGARVRARRLELGLSQREVAARFGCQVPQISAFENGARARVSLKTLARLALALEIERLELLKAIGD